jgi:hypothetical protein
MGAEAADLRSSLGSRSPRQVGSGKAQIMARLHGFKGRTAAVSVGTRTLDFPNEPWRLSPGKPVRAASGRGEAARRISLATVSA